MRKFSKQQKNKQDLTHRIQAIGFKLWNNRSLIVHLTLDQYLQMSEATKGMIEAFISELEDMINEECSQRY